MKKFEYKLIEVSVEKLDKASFQFELMNKLNGYGAEGWELISAEGLNSSSFLWHVADTTTLIFMFKRQML